MRYFDPDALWWIVKYLAVIMSALGVGLWVLLRKHDDYFAKPWKNEWEGPGAYLLANGKMKVYLFDLDTTYLDGLVYVRFHEHYRYMYRLSDYRAGRTITPTTVRPLLNDLEARTETGYSIHEGGRVPTPGGGHNYLG